MLVIKDPVLLFSFDLVDSAQIKNDIQNLSKSKTDDIFSMYYSKFIDFEISLYKKIICNSSISLKNLYLIKTIGDEYWYLYRLQNDASDFLSVIQELICQAPDKYTINNPAECEIGENKLIEHKYKCFLDYCDGKSSAQIASYSIKRSVLLNKFITANYLKLSHDLPFSEESTEIEKAAEIQELYSKNLGMYEFDSRKCDDDTTQSLIIPRFDPIGPAIDLFFRCNKEKMSPQCLHIGEKMYNHLSDNEKSNFEIIHKFAPKGFPNDFEYTMYRRKT